jgi:hypothetical protein
MSGGGETGASVSIRVAERDSRSVRRAARGSLRPNYARDYLGMRGERRQRLERFFLFSDDRSNRGGGVPEGGRAVDES